MKRDIRVVSIFATFAVLVLSSCGGASEPIPPVPTVSVEGVDPEIRAAVLEAHSKAEAEPENADASGRLGMILQAHTMYSPAEQAYRRAIGLKPNEFAWKYYLALTLREESKLEESLEELNEALKIRPDYAPALIQRGEVLFELGRVDESSEALESVLADTPNSASALYALARVKNAQGDLEASADLYRRAARVLPTFGAAYFGLGTAQQGMGNDAEAERNFELAAPRMGMANEPQEDPLQNEMLDMRTGPLNRVKLAEQKIYQAKWGDAATLLNEVLERDPNNLDGLLTSLFLGASTGEIPMDQMETYFQRARQVAPQNPDIYMYYATALANSNRASEAIPWLNKSIELDPNYAEAHTLLASILEQQNRNSQAIEHYRLALEAKPYHRPARLHLTKLLLNMGRYKEAIPELQKALEVDDQDTAMVMVSLGYAYASTGDVGKAQEYFRHAQSRVKRTGPKELLQQIEAALAGMGLRP